MPPFFLLAARHSIPQAREPPPSFPVARQLIDSRVEAGQQCRALIDRAAHPQAALELHVIDQELHPLQRSQGCHHWQLHAASHPQLLGDAAMHPSSVANSAPAQVVQVGARPLLLLLLEPVDQHHHPVSIAVRALADVAVRLLAPGAEQVPANVPLIRQRYCRPVAAHRAASFRTGCASCRAPAQTNLRDPVQPVDHHRHRHRHRLGSP